MACTPTIPRFTVPAVLRQSMTFRRGPLSVGAVLSWVEVQQVVTELRQNQSPVVRVR